MKLLLTNDDGIRALGLHALISVLSADYELYVVAPDRERSGTGHSITVFDPIRVRKIDLPSVKAAWKVSGTPVDCVKLGLEELIGTQIDYVISGINHGSNLGTDVLYSGTVSAAAEGVIMGCPAMAISLNNYQPQPSDFDFSAQYILEVLKKLGPQGLDPHTLLNINVPPVGWEDYQGTMVTKLGVRKYQNTFEARQDPRGNIYYWLGGGLCHDDQDQDQDSDVHAVQTNHISITPIQLDLTDYRLIDRYKKIFADNKHRPALKDQNAIS